jgi:peptidoglycan/xylan/chitin deacetylase (PgdA/CDA1 family)
MMNGSFSFRGLAVTTTSSLWKKTTVAITVPLGVVAMSVYRIVDHAGTFIIDDVSLTAPALPQGKGYVTFSFDDGRNQSAAIPILHSYGIKATFFLNPTPIIENWEPGVVLTPLEVATLVKDGHEIANHTLTHPQLIGVNPDLLVQEVAGSKELLEKMTGRSILTFAYPFGVFDAEAYSVVSKYHIGARGVSDKTLNLRTSDRYNLNAYTPLPGAPLSKTKAQIDQAVKSGQWLVLVFHSIGPLDTMGAYSNLPKDLSALISYAKQKTQIITVREGLSRFVK